MYDIERLKQQNNFKDGSHWVCPINFYSEVNRNLEGRTIGIHDVTLRDGEQTFGVAFSVDERIQIAQALSDLGVARIEAGMPVISSESRTAIKHIVEANLDSEITALVRAHKLDIDLSEECGLRTVIVEHCLNPYLNEQGYGLDMEGVVSRCAESVRYAKEKGFKAIFMGWDTTRIDDFDYLRDFYLSLASQCEPDAIVLVDTFGTALPGAAGFLVNKVREWVPGVSIEYHNHNEFGLANAGMLEAVAAGADVVHSAMNGLGERTGNAATEELAAMFELMAGVKTGVDLSKLMDVSLLVENTSRRPVLANKPIVGRGLFDVETGVAADLIVKMEEKGFDMSVSPMVPSVVGQPPSALVLGKNSGKATIEFYLHKNNRSASPDQIDEIVSRVKFQGRLQRTLLSETQFLAICDKVL
ncbi:MAG: hypothetical protein M0Q49_00665 [Porticoccaceae bacterium]|nr:hypothetical protein [Porticoccaceae bacterium]